MLAVRAWFPPKDLASIVVDPRSLQGDVLAVAFHCQLLKIGRKALQVLFIRQNCDRLRVEKIRIPKREQPEQDREVAFERRGAEVLIHFVKTAQHSPEIVGSDGEHGRKSN